VQALVFADGGLTALGANITNMAMIGVAAGFLVALALRPLVTRGKAGLVTVAFVAAFANTVIASLGFVLQFALGGDAAFSLGGVTGTVVGLHCLIGIGEGVITALTVGAVASARPDLVYLLRGTAAPLELRESPVRSAP
jgi:cobalt/nickel transport system permease protein